MFSVIKKMKRLYSIICGNYRKFEKSKISYFLEKTLVIYIICSKCKNEDEKIFKEEESIQILKTLGLINNTERYQIYIIMSEENINQEFRLKKINKIRNYSKKKIKIN